MVASYLAGQPVADRVLQEVKTRTAQLERQGIKVGLGTILAGGDEASAGYVRKKHETAATVGVQSFNVEVPIEAGQKGLLEAVEAYNADPAVDAFLIQYPVPQGFDFNEAVSRMAPAKDADGLHPESLGKLAYSGDVVHPVRRKPSTRSGPFRPLVGA
jgi:methylenetetrahydrofolate dehydrogenase (NADP+) / methenyltetrahydrofolate cyclohydrolase